MKAGAGDTAVGSTPTFSAPVQRALHNLEDEAAGGCQRLLSVWVGRPAEDRALRLPHMESEAAGVLPPFRKWLGRGDSAGVRDLGSPLCRCSSAWPERGPHKAGRQRSESVHRYVVLLALEAHLAERRPGTTEAGSSTLPRGSAPAALLLAFGEIAQMEELPVEARCAKVRPLLFPRSAQMFNGR